MLGIGITMFFCLSYAAKHKQIVPAAATILGVVAISEVVIRFTFGQSLPGRLAISVPVFFVASIAVRQAFPDVWPRQVDWACQRCNQDLRGISAIECPRCSQSIADSFRRFKPAWECYTCDYDLRGVTTQVCPECGTPFKGQYETPATRA